MAMCKTTRKSTAFRTAPRILGVAALLILSLAFCGCGRTTRQETVQVRPRDASVLFITLDTTRADHLSCYASASAATPSAPGAAMRASPLKNGFRSAKTPNLDALAARGARFAHATAQIPLTLPSHACMFTGTYPEVHGLRDMGGFVLDPRHVTLATMAKQAGFLTAAFVGSKAVGRHFGLQQGFDVYDDQMPTRGAEGQLPGVFPERRAQVTTDHALDWLKQHGHENFFLWVHYYDAHEPYDPPEPYKHQYANDPYSGEIAYTDGQVGRLFDFLAQQNLRERTLVIVIGDHGEGLNDHGEATHGIFIYDDTLHVPLIVAGPGVPAGLVIEPQVRSIDLLPTTAEFLRLAPNPAAQGVTLWPLIEHGQPAVGKGSNYAYIETLYPRTYMNWSELRGMRTDKWKFVLAPHPELYDLERDPGEKENVIAHHPVEADHLQRKIWEVIGPPSQDQKVTYVPLNKETRQELESLGYVSAGTPREIVLNGNAADPKDRVSILLAMQQYDRAMKAQAYAQAARVMEAAIPADPANPLARLYLGRAYERMRDWPRAIATYRGAIDIGVATDDLLSRLGKAYLRMGDLPKGAEAMEGASRINPTDLDNLRNLGTALLQLGRVEDAERTFKSITVQDDRYSAAYNGLGLVAIQRGDADAARRDFEKAIEVDPEEVEPLMNLGVLFDKAGNKDLALRYYQQFLEKASPQDYGALIPKVRAAVRDLKSGV